MRTSLIITTYNRPDALRLVLDSVAGQTVPADEVIVADDGSGEDTARIVAEKRAEYNLPIKHAWQEDQGFRAARVRNLGVSMATSEYLIFVDGDILLHRAFVKSHLVHARPGRLLHGSRALISDERAKRITDGLEAARFGLFQAGLRSRFNMIHCLPLSYLFSRPRSHWKSRGCNLSMFYRDFAAVNGFNEDFVGWGKEDSELVLRLMRNGVEKFNLRCCAVAYHLGHGWSHERQYDKEHAENESRLMRHVRGDLIRCAHGLDGHLAAVKLDKGTQQ